MKQQSIHVNFCKCSMGKRMESTNIAVLVEMERYPLFLGVIVNISKKVFVWKNTY